MLGNSSGASIEFSRFSAHFSCAKFQFNRLGAAKSAIAKTRNSNHDNPWYGFDASDWDGNATEDKVFLLSLGELVKYFGDSGDLRNKKGYDFDWGSEKYFPISNGPFLYDQYNSARIANYGNEGASWWWLRSPGYISSLAACVSYDGCVDVNGIDVSADSGGVRPALWIKL